ncbi:hypothetical protein L6R53_19815 [Myxococcota bacterium]|nr:hypothetical protein [Myxococcota bacterium]
MPKSRFITWSQVTLVFVGACYLLLGIVMIPLFPMMAAADGNEVPPAVALGFSLFILVVAAGFGLLNFVAAWGLGRRAKWAWIMTIILGGIYAPSGCMPFGVLLLYAMLNAEGRAQFEG